MFTEPETIPGCRNAAIAKKISLNSREASYHPELKCQESPKLLALELQYIILLPPLVEVGTLCIENNVQ